ncbi:MAG: hypothetical protein HYY67_06775 [Thaumarchaeota archaeon]|nr:hypothetical protein [Nitrososphaerota archaeon]
MTASAWVRLVIEALEMKPNLFSGETSTQDVMNRLLEERFKALDQKIELIPQKIKEGFSDSNTIEKSVQHLNLRKRLRVIILDSRNRGKVTQCSTIEELRDFVCEQDPSLRANLVTSKDNPTTDFDFVFVELVRAGVISTGSFETIAWNADKMKEI